MKSALKILAVILLACIAYVGYWEFQYQRAEADANKFCASVPLGSNVSKAIAQAQAMEGVRHGFQDNQSRYIVMFKGPIFNSFFCELSLADGKVTSKHAGVFGD